MSEGYRGAEQELGPSRWLRGRWKYGSVLVLDIDNLICSPDGERGLLIEWKHRDAADKTWRITRKLARDLRWFAALLIYETDESGFPVNIEIETQEINGNRHGPIPLDESWFDGWVCERLGAVPREVAA